MIDALILLLALLAQPGPQPEYTPDRWTFPSVAFGPTVAGTRAYLVVRFDGAEPIETIRPHLRWFDGHGHTLTAQPDPDGPVSVAPVRLGEGPTDVVLESCYRSHPRISVVYAVQPGPARMVELLLSRGQIESRLDADLNFDGSADGDDIQRAADAAGGT